MNFVAFATALIPLLFSPNVLGHDPGLSRSELRNNAGEFTFSLAVHERDVPASLDDWSSLVASGLRASCDGRPLPMEFGPAVRDRAGGILSTGRMRRVGCEVLEIRAPLLARMTPGHRQILLVYDGGNASPATHILTAARPLASVVLARETPVAGLTTMVTEGIRHILVGPDHLAFILTLLFGVLLTGCEQALSGAQTARRMFVIITAFTVAHSLTLGLAAMNVLALPSRPVEIVIALSIVVAGLLNLLPRWRRHGALLALGFGLIHGFGFASAFAELALPGERVRWLTVAQFNLGVELGQLIVVVPLLGVGLWLMSKVRMAPRLAAQGSVGTACLGMLWVVQRAVG